MTKTRDGLRVNAVTKAFGGLVAVRELSFEVQPKEIVGLIGPNGAGKSTIFNVISGITTPTLGTIEFCSKRIDGLRPETIASMGMARSFQHVQLLPQMSVLENVMLGAYSRGEKGIVASSLHLERDEEAAIEQEARAQLERCHLIALADMPAGAIALGQQRIVEVARALCAAPSMLLLDEPAAGLRHQEKEALAKLLRRLRDEGLGILLVEHDMDFVMNLVDRLVVVDFGTKIAEGSPEDVQKNPQVIEAYLGGIE